MGTIVRPEVSDKSEYWVERHRYYELKHFCLQYPIWKKAYEALDGYSTRSACVVETPEKYAKSDPTARVAESRLYFYERMKMLETTSIEAGPLFGTYLLKAVTEGISFECLKTKYGIPCCKETYYDVYRRFFWLLSKARN